MPLCDFSHPAPETPTLRGEFPFRRCSQDAHRSNGEPNRNWVRTYDCGRRERVTVDGGLMERIDTDTLWMAEGSCRDQPPSLFFPSDGVGVDRAPQDLRDLSGEGRVPGVRPVQPHRSRCVGWYLRTRASPHPQAPPVRRCRRGLTNLPRSHPARSARAATAGSSRPKGASSQHAAQQPHPRPPGRGWLLFRRVSRGRTSRAGCGPPRRVARRATVTAARGTPQPPLPPIHCRGGRRLRRPCRRARR